MFPLGAGGMGEVYRARDTQLNRGVAIKVLPQLFALDHERLTRFTREAQTLAALNHLNIAQIYGLEAAASTGTTRALVLELVDGEDLSALIARGPVPLHEALPIARQIAVDFEIAADGTRFLLHLEERTTEPPVHLLLNWRARQGGQQ
ncbi:MAG: protein kinase [Acidobacteria bacterium]|nr:protein kinase [Acidobacteriota bacterium]MCA1649088.1 protein kinase [Acidobacteriota bacterium]